jgi:hypothetical protein
MLPYHSHLRATMRVNIVLPSELSDNDEKRALHIPGSALGVLD